MHLLMRKSSSPVSRTKDLAVWYSLTMHSERRTSLLLGRLEKIELSERERFRLKRLVISHGTLFFSHNKIVSTG